MIISMYFVLPSSNEILIEHALLLLLTQDSDIDQNVEVNFGRFSNFSSNTNALIIPEPNVILTRNLEQRLTLVIKIQQHHYNKL